MKTVHLYGISAMLLIIGILLWIIQSVLIYLAWFVVACGITAAIIGLIRWYLPIAEKRHQQAMDWQSVDLQQQLVNYVIANQGDFRRDANGTIEGKISRSTVRQQSNSEPEPEPEDTNQEIPTDVRYEDIANQVPRGHSVLGVSENGLETCDFKDLMTMLISGGSSTGKSNTVAIKLHEAITIGRNTRMVVIDPHKNKPDSLYNKIRQHEARFLMPVAQKDEEIIQALRWFKQEFDRRLELSTKELEQLDDILLVCDEVYALVYHREDERIKNLIKLVSGTAGYESRGYGMYAWFLTQKVTGLKWLRDAVMTTICHKMQTMSERVLASNDDRAVARDMDNWVKGRVVVFGLNLPVTVAQMPLFSLPSSGLPNSSMNFRREDFREHREANGEADGRMNHQEDDNPSPELVRKVLTDAAKLKAQGESIDAILKKYDLPGGGRLNQNLKSLLVEQEG